MCNSFLDTPEVKQVCEIVRKISRYVGAQGSAQRMQSWLHVCGKYLPLDSRTRWSSTRDMLKIAVDLRDKIPTWRRGLPSAKDRSDLEITEAQWDKVILLLELLEPFAKATAIANQMEQPISFVLPLYNVMYNELMKKAVDLRYVDFAPAIASGMYVLNEYYGYTTDTLTAATVLDPRANLYFFDTYWQRCGYESVADVEDRVREVLAPYLVSVEAADQAPNSDPDDMLGAPTAVTGPRDELFLYRREPQLPRGEDPLLWWKVNGSRYPGLAKAARDFLTARCTSAPSERAFSLGRQLISEFRHQLSADTIKKLMLLQSWMAVLEM